MLDIEELTEVQRVNDNLYFKRDDLFKPFEDIPLNGGKVRQAINLLKSKEDYIKNECDSNIYQSQSMSSPQGIIITRVANEFGFHTQLFLGNTKPKSFARNNLIITSLALGCRVNYESKQAYNSVINSVIERHKNNGERFFRSEFSMNIEDESIFMSNGNQVQNIPNDLDYIVIPCGLCISAVGVMKGLLKFNKIPKKVYLIQIAGYDRRDDVIKYLGDDSNELDWEFLISKDYPYSREVHKTYNGIRLDPHYEAKGFDYYERYMMKNLDDKKGLFWIVGDSTDIRKYVPDIKR